MAKGFKTPNCSPEMAGFLCPPQDPGDLCIVACCIITMDRLCLGSVLVPVRYLLNILLYMHLLPALLPALGQLYRSI